MIRAPDGVEVGDAKAGFPVELFEVNLEGDFDSTSIRIRHSSPVTLREANSRSGLDDDDGKDGALEQLKKNFFSRTKESLLNLFEEAHKEVMMECDDDNAFLPSSSNVSEKLDVIEIDFFQPALSPPELTRGNSDSPLNEADLEKERSSLVQELENRLGGLI